MVGEREAQYLAWIWLYSCLGWKQLIFDIELNQIIGNHNSNDQILISDRHEFNADDEKQIYLKINYSNTNNNHRTNSPLNKRMSLEKEYDKIYLQQCQISDHLSINAIASSTAANLSSTANLSPYLYAEEKEYNIRPSFNDIMLESTITHESRMIANPSLNQHHIQQIQSILKLIASYSGFMFGWQTPWIIQKSDKLLRNLHLYQRTFQYPSQSLSNDLIRAEHKKYMQTHNRNNLFTDSILLSTISNGYYLGNILNGNWYKLGFECPQLENLKAALKRGSMAVDLFPRSSRLYFAGGLVMGMPISTVAKLDLESMKLSPVTEMPLPRAYPCMVFFPDSLVLIGGTNCWEEVFSTVDQYDFLAQTWERLPKLHNARYGASAVTLDERYIFVAGGCDRMYPVMESEWYDRKKRRWMCVGSLLQPQQRCHSLRYMDDVLLVGSHSRVVQKFDVVKQHWSFAGQLNYSYSSGVKMCTFDYRLIAANRKNIISHYEIFDHQSLQWICTNARSHPVMKLYPFDLKSSLDGCYSSSVLLGNVSEDVDDEIFGEWYHLGRRFW